MVNVLDKHDFPFSLKSFWIDQFRSIAFARPPKKIYTRNCRIYHRDDVMRELTQFYFNGIDTTIESLRQTFIDQLNGKLGPTPSMSIECKMAPKFVDGKLHSVSLVPPSFADFDQPSIEVPMATNYIPGGQRWRYPSSDTIILSNLNNRKKAASSACEAMGMEVD